MQKCNILFNKIPAFRHFLDENIIYDAQIVNWFNLYKKVSFVIYIFVYIVYRKGFILESFTFLTVHAFIFIFLTEKVDRLSKMYDTHCDANDNPYFHN